MRHVSGWIGAAFVLVISACGPAPEPPSSTVPSTPAAAAPSAPAIAAGDWPAINRDPSASRYSPLTQITTANVTGLQSSWTYTLGGNSTAVPIVVDGVMYLPSRDRVVAVDGDTGMELWAYALPPSLAPPPPPASAAGAGSRPGGGPRGGGGPSASTRGVSYWPGDGTLAPRILFMSGANLVALDAATGKPAAGFGSDGAVNVSVPYGGTPTVYQNVAIIGASSGEVPQGPPGNPRAFDLRTGEKLWEFQTVPRPGEPFNETWGNGWEHRGGTNMWGFAAPLDVARGIAYLPIAGPAANYYGGDRPGNNVFGNSIVAVDAKTGKYLWHFQTVHHDLWDTDMPSAGALFDFMQNGTRVPAIAQVGKSSFMYILNRTTGEPLLGVKETPVPKGDVPTEWYSPTQPIPVLPPPLARVSFSEADLVRAEDTTPEHAAACREFMARSGGFYNAGPFTPFLYKAPDAPPKSTIQFPGGTGGVNWGGVADRSEQRLHLRHLARRRARRVGPGQGSERHLQLRSRRLEAALRPCEHQRRRTVLHLQRSARREVRRERSAGRPVGAVPAPAVGQARGRERQYRRDRLGVDTGPERAAAGRQTAHGECR